MDKIPYYSDILDTNFTERNANVTIHSVPESHKVELSNCCLGEVKLNKSVLASTSPFLKQCLLETTEMAHIFINAKPETLKILSDFMTKGVLSFDHTDPRNLGLLVEFLAFGINLQSLNLISTSNRDYKNVFEDIENNDANPFDLVDQYTDDDVEDSELQSKNEVGFMNGHSNILENHNYSDITKDFKNDKVTEAEKTHTDSKIELEKNSSDIERLIHEDDKKFVMKKRMIEQLEQSKTEIKIAIMPPPKDTKFGLLFDELVAPDEENCIQPDDLDLKQFESLEIMENEMNNIEEKTDKIKDEILMELSNGIEVEKIKDCEKSVDSLKIKKEENSDGTFKSTLVDLNRYKMEHFDTKRKRWQHTNYLNTLGLDVDTFLPKSGSQFFRNQHYWMNFEVKEGTRIEKKYNCKECLYSTDYRDNFLQHKLRHKHIELMKKKGFTHFCTASPKCDGIGFFSLANLKKHLLEKHVEKKEKCELCDKMVASRYFMAHEEFFHLQTKLCLKPEIKYENKVCINCGYNKEDNHHKNYLTHLRAKGKYHDDRCEQCEGKFKSWEEKKTHMTEVHNNVWYYRCGKCGDVFENTGVLGYHNLKEHIQKMKTELCEICNKTFLPRRIEKHKKMAHEDKQVYTCELCGKCVVGKYFIDVHKREHHIKDKECEVCGEIFKRGTSTAKFSRHRLAHRKMEDRPWGCEVCPKRFNSKVLLTEHKNIHTGEKPFSCDICGAKFANKANMYHHRRGTHLGKKRIFKKKYT